MNRSLFLLAVTVAFGTITSLACARDKDQHSEKEMSQPQGTTNEGNTIVVRVGSAADCVNTPPTMKLIQETALEMGLHINLSRQVVSTQEEANQYRFIGSPTVHIDGLDLQAEMRANTHYGFT